jgi:hypothetical protein
MGLFFIGLSLHIVTWKYNHSNTTVRSEHDKKVRQFKQKWPFTAVVNPHDFEGGLQSCFQTYAEHHLAYLIHGSELPADLLSLDLKRQSIRSAISGHPAFESKARARFSNWELPSLSNEDTARLEALGLDLILQLSNQLSKTTGIQIKEGSLSLESDSQWKAFQMEGAVFLLTLKITCEPSMLNQWIQSMASLGSIAEMHLHNRAFPEIKRPIGGFLLDLQSAEGSSAEAIVFGINDQPLELDILIKQYAIIIL